MADPDAHPRDLSQPVAITDIPEAGMLVGTVGDERVLLTRSGNAVQAFGAKCTHLGAPLGEGLLVGETIRCPWHHACFDRTTGEAVRAPAFDPLPRWTVVRNGDSVQVTGRAAPPVRTRRTEDHSLPGIVIVGGGAAGYAAAAELRRLGHEDAITIVSSEIHEPYDRTLLTKDYLDGKFGDDHLPIARATLAVLGVTFLGGQTVTAIDRHAKLIRCNDSRALPYTGLLLATGAEPKRLEVPGHDLPHVAVLRSLDDCRGILARLRPDTRVVVIGASFIGLEAAASIRTRGVAVTVVTPEATPMSRIVGPDLADTILGAHRAKGVAFRLEATVTAITPEAVLLRDGSSVPADLVIVGIGVAPRTALAEAAGLKVDKGVVVDDHLRTTDPDIFAAGDIARWPDRASGETMRVEHWVVAERQGQVAARNMLGGAQVFDAVPFFWGKHFDLSFRYLGHAEQWDSAQVDGDLATRKAVIRFSKDGVERAVVTVGQDVAALRIEAAMEEERHQD